MPTRLAGVWLAAGLVALALIAPRGIARTAAPSDPAAPGAPAAPAAGPPSVCRGLVEIVAEPRPWRTCDVGRLKVVFRPICTAQRVHLVYVLDPSTHLSWSLGMLGSVNQLNLKANPNIHVAGILVLGSRPALVEPFDNDITRIQRGLDDLLRRWRPTPGPNGTPSPDDVGCGACGVRTAMELLARHRQDAAPDRVAEYIAYFGATDRAPPNGMDPRDYAALETTVADAKRAGITVIAGDRDLASSDAYWIGGLKGLGPAFSRIAVDHNGTQLRDMSLALQLPDHTRVISYAVQPAGYRVEAGGRRLVWTDPPWSIDGVTLTLAMDVLAPAPAALDLPRLEARLGCYRGRTRVLTLPDPATLAETLPIADGCTPPTPTGEPPAPDPSPSSSPPPSSPTPAASPTRTPWPAPTAGPTPTAPRRPGAAFLPLAVRERCAGRGRAMDLVLVVDLSTSMRGSNLTAALEAGLAVVDVLAEAAREHGTAPRLGLIGFHQSAATIVPATARLDAVRARLADVARAPEGWLAPGTRIDLGLGAARDLLAGGPEPARQGVILLLTDGILPEGLYTDALETARGAREQHGLAIYTVGLGTLFDARFLEALAGRPDRFTPAVEPGELAAVWRGLVGALVCEGVG